MRRIVIEERGNAEQNQQRRSNAGARRRRAPTNPLNKSFAAQKADFGTPIFRSALMKPPLRVRQTPV
jgi:hypothetical protein